MDGMLLNCAATELCTGTSDLVRCLAGTDAVHNYNILNAIGDDGRRNARTQRNPGLVRGMASLSGLDGSQSAAVLSMQVRVGVRCRVTW